MRAAAGQRNNVVNLLHECDAAFFEALFAQGMLSSIASTYPVPSSAVLAGCVRGAFVPIVLLARLLPVFLAVGAVSQIWAPGVCARLFWFLGHWVCPF